MNVLIFAQAEGEVCDSGDRKGAADKCIRLLESSR